MRALLFGAALATLLSSAAHANAVSDANAGEQALTQGNYSEAVRLFTQAINTKDLSQADRESAHVERAKAYLGLGDKAAALHDLDRAEQFNPNDKDIAALREQAQSGTVTQERAAPGGEVQTAQAGPSLVETMSFIQQNVAAQGVLNYASLVHDASNNSDWVNRFTVEASNVRADPASCHIAYHWKTSRNGEPGFDLEGGIPLASVQSVQVVPMSQDINEGDAKAGHPTWTSQINPPVFVVKVFRTEGHSNVFDFYSEDIADRVAKAVQHAADLCGAKSPF